MLQKLQFSDKLSFRESGESGLQIPTFFYQWCRFKDSLTAPRWPLFSAVFHGAIRYSRAFQAIGKHESPLPTLINQLRRVH